MRKPRLSEVINIVDKTENKDDPYNDWEVGPMDKFIEELLEENYTMNEIINYDLDGEHGILADYRLLPREHLKYDSENRVMILKMKYPTLYEYKKALMELGVMYDEKYWQI